MRDDDDPTNNRGLGGIGPFDGHCFILSYLSALRLETGCGVLLLRLYSGFDFGVVPVEHNKTENVERCR